MSRRQESAQPVPPPTDQPPRTGEPLTRREGIRAWAMSALRDVVYAGLPTGLAVAVLLDATIVWAVLLPATMALLEDRNWYLPRWLEWLPRIGHEPPATPTHTRHERAPRSARDCHEVTSRRERVT